MIYLVWLRVAPLPGCKVVPDAADDALECALEAAAPERVPALLNDALHRHRQQVRELEACIPFEPDAWTDANDPDSRVRRAAEAVRTKGGVQFASFGRKP